MNQQNILFTNNTAQAIDTAINNIRPNGIFVLTDKNTAVDVLAASESGKHDDVRSHTDNNQPRRHK